jgi:hypothetical protein
VDLRPTLPVDAKLYDAHLQHPFRHSLATNLRAAGVDLKTAQELLRYANSQITLEVYTRAISSTKREANDRVMQTMLEAGSKQLSAPSRSDFGGKKWRYKLAPEVRFDLQHPQVVSGIVTMPPNR